MRSAYFAPARTGRKAVPPGMRCKGHTRAVPSPLVVTNAFPSGANSTDQSTSVCPRRMRKAAVLDSNNGDSLPNPQWLPPLVTPATRYSLSRALRISETESREFSARSIDTVLAIRFHRRVFLAQSEFEQIVQFLVAGLKWIGLFRNRRRFAEHDLPDQIAQLKKIERLRQ